MRFTFRRQKNRKGVILPVVLVIVVILGIMAAGLSRTARFNLGLARRAVATVNSKYLAWAGIVYAIDEIRKDSKNMESVGYDRIGLCGIAPESALSLRERFSDVALGTGVLDIGYELDSGSVIGFSDEESKINLNGLNTENIGVFVHLLQLLGEDEENARAAGYALLDWKDADDELSHMDYGAEDAYYMELPKPYHIKNFFFESLDELLFVKNIDARLLESARPYLTIYPQDDFLRINLETASEIVLRAAGRSFTGGQTNADIQDADALAQKLVDYRSGQDNRPGTDDDRLLDFQDVSLNQKENVIAEKLRQLQTVVSDHIRVRVRAVENQRRMASTVEAVIDRNDLAIVQWKRQ